MPASAAPADGLGNTLGRLWTTLLETPAPQNPFSGGPAETACWDLDGVLAPLGPAGVTSRTVKRGTKILEAGYAFECSTFDGDSPVGTASEAQLRSCTEAGGVQGEPVVTLDGQPVPLVATHTPLLHVTLPADNLFGEPAGTTGLYVGRGWVAELHPMAPGSHVLVGGGAVSAPERGAI